MINAAVSTNFGAGPGPAFNAENIFINLVNNLVQGNDDAGAAFDAIARGTSLTSKIAATYRYVILPEHHTDEGLVFITRPEGLAFY